MKTTSIPFRSAEFLIVRLGLGKRRRFPERNICLFVRAWLASIIKFTILTFLAGFFLHSFIFFWVSVFGLNFPTEHEGAFLFLISGGVVSTVALLLGLMLGYDWLKDKYEDRKLAKYMANPTKGFKELKPKEPSLFSLWLKSKKEKLCFDLEFIDPNEPVESTEPNEQK